MRKVASLHLKVAIDCLKISTNRPLQFGHFNDETMAILIYSVRPGFSGDINISPVEKCAEMDALKPLKQIAVIISNKSFFMTDTFMRNGVSMVSCKPTLKKLNAS